MPKISIDLTPGPCTAKQQVFIDNICTYYGLPMKQMNSDEARTFLNKWAKRFFADMSQTYRIFFAWYHYKIDTLDNWDPDFFKLFTGDE